MPAVVSGTDFISDGIRNAIPTHVTIKGDRRSYSSEVQSLLQNRLRDISLRICQTHGAHCTFEFTHGIEPTVNTHVCVKTAVQAASNLVGAANVDPNIAPVMACEDFGAFLKLIPGDFSFIGNGRSGAPGGIALHDARYDFNDVILTRGARYFAEIARLRLRD